jgi:phenylacetate-coenzyme A ligase PaaK-like adenylate-forming protein
MKRKPRKVVVEEELLVEIVRPGTGDPVEPGEVGEVVVTTFNPDYPLIRFATGDLSAMMPGRSPCGRSNVRLKGWMGRADQTTKVKGMFVHPEQVAEIACAIRKSIACAWWSTIRAARIAWCCIAKSRQAARRSTRPWSAACAR